MDVQSSNTSGVNLEIAALKLEKNQQEQEGQAAIQLLESAGAATPAPSSDGVRGTIINTFA